MSLRKQTELCQRGRQAPVSASVFSPWIWCLAASWLLWPIFSSAAEPGPSLDYPTQPGKQRFLASAAAFAIFSGASNDVKQALQWVMESTDNRRLPFAIVDKKAARIFVFEADGQLHGASPALLGLAPGDGGLVSLVNRPVTSLTADERTTPAGRFASEPGHNLNGEAIVWIDYAAKLAISFKNKNTGGFFINNGKWQAAVVCRFHDPLQLLFDVVRCVGKNSECRG